MNKKLALIIAGLVGIMSVGVIAVNNDYTATENETVLISETMENEIISDYDYRVVELKDNGILIGDEKGNLDLKETLKRQEMVVLISRLMGKETEAKNWNTSSLTFLDVAKDNWAAPYIAWAKDNNITKGYSDEWFGYDDSLTLTQTQIFILRILGYNEVDMDDAEHLAYTTGLMSGVKNVENNEIIRSDVAIMLYNTLYIEDEEQNTLANELGIIASLTESEKGLKNNMEYYNVEFLKKTDIENDWVFIYIDASNSTLSEKNEDEYKAFIHSIVAVIGYKNIKIMDTTSELEIIAYCDAEINQILALEVDGVYNYFNMKESF